MPKLKGASQLRLWLRTEPHKMNQREFAALAQLHWTHVNQILSGRRKPSLSLAVNLHALTGIPVDSWATPQESVADVERRLAKARQRKRARDLAKRVAREAASAATGEAPAPTDVQAPKSTDELGETHGAA